LERSQNAGPPSSFPAHPILWHGFNSITTLPPVQRCIYVKMEGEYLLHLRSLIHHSACRILLTSFLAHCPASASWRTALHQSLFSVPFLVLPLLSLLSDSDLKAWPDCWVSVDFLLSPIPSVVIG